MKGRVLLTLLFVAFLALGISSLNDLKQEITSLPPAEKTAACIAPPVALPEESELHAAALPHASAIESRAAAVPPQDRCENAAPPLLQSYYLACYQAFHFSDCAG